MKSARLVSYLAVLATALLPLHASAQPAPAGFVSFAAFMSTVVTASADTYLLHPDSKIRSATDFEEMRHHLLSLYAGVHVGHSFLYNDQYVDCVPILEQPSARALGLKELPQLPAPARPPGVSNAPSTPSPLSMGLSDRFGNAVSCAIGTIPMRRITLDEFARFATLRDYFRKAPSPASPSPTVNYAGYKHRYFAFGATNIGAGVQFEVWYPFVDTSQGEYHSLSQLWVLGYPPYPPTYGNKFLQTLEVGWQVAPQHYNTTAAVPFTYWTADDYNYTGCYNLECPGFVQYDNRIVLGVPAWPGPSQPGGQQVIHDFTWQAVVDQNGTVLNWVLYYDAETNYSNYVIVGYLSPTWFGSGQLSMSANNVYFGGETYSSSSTYGAMGSGYLPSAGAAYSAYQSAAWYVYYAPQSPTYKYAQSVNLAYGNNPPSDACYGELCLSYQGQCSSFLFGGPGGLNCPGQ